MGYMRHHALIVQGSGETLAEAHRRAKELIPDDSMIGRPNRHVTDISPMVMNHYEFFSDLPGRVDRVVGPVGPRRCYAGRAHRHVRQRRPEPVGIGSGMVGDPVR